MKFYTVDVETTGTDANRHSIVSIGAVNVTDPSDTFYKECRIWDGASVEQEALRVNGFSMAYVTDQSKPSESEIIIDFMKWLQDKPMMIAHNAAFDRDFVSAACKRAGFTSKFSFRTIDIHSITMMRILQNGDTPPESLSLNKCLTYLGFPPEPNPHNALTGAQCNALIFKKLSNKEDDGQMSLV